MDAVTILMPQLASNQECTAFIGERSCYYTAWRTCPLGLYSMVSEPVVLVHVADREAHVGKIYLSALRWV